MAAYKDTLRSLALNDEQFVDSVLGMGRHDRRLRPRSEDTCPAPPRGRAGRRRGAQLLPVDRGDRAGRGRRRRRDRRVPDRSSSHRRSRTCRVGRARVGAGARLRRGRGPRSPGRGHSVNPASAARAPHRVGLRSLRRLVEHRTHTGTAASIAELERLREIDRVRVIDPLAVYKDAAGEIEVEHLCNLPRARKVWRPAPRQGPRRSPTECTCSPTRRPGTCGHRLRDDGTARDLPDHQRRGAALRASHSIRPRSNPLPVRLRQVAIVSVRRGIIPGTVCRPSCATRR